MAVWTRMRDGLWETLDVGWPGMDRRLLTLSRDRLGYRSTKFPIFILFLPHCVVILGMFFSAPILLALWALGMDLPERPALFPLIATPFSLPFLIFLPILLGHRSTLIDRRRGTVREARGLGLPLSPILPLIVRRCALADFSEVVLRLETRSTGKSGSSEVYVISLATADDMRVRVVEALRFRTARRLGERVAAFAHLPLRDETGGRHCVRLPEALDQPLAENRSALGPVPALPAGSALRLPADGAAPWRVDLPAPAFPHWRLAGYGLLFLLLAGAAALVRPRIPEEPPAPTFVERPSPTWAPPSPWPRRAALAADGVLIGLQVLTGLTALGFLFAFCGRLATWPRGFAITVEAGALTIGRRGPLGERRVLFPRAELEEIRVEARSGRWRLLAISDRCLFPFADGLDAAEAEALRYALIRALRGCDVGRFDRG